MTSDTFLALQKFVKIALTTYFVRKLRWRWTCQIDASRISIWLRKYYLSRPHSVLLDAVLRLPLMVLVLSCLCAHTDSETSHYTWRLDGDRVMPGTAPLNNPPPTKTAEKDQGWMTHSFRKQMIWAFCFNVLGVTNSDRKLSHHWVYQGKLLRFLPNTFEIFFNAYASLYF